MTARRHHYLAQCYLKGFVADRKKPRIFLADFERKITCNPNPINVGVEGDFNRVDIDGLSIDALENALGNFETKLANALVRTIKAREIVSTEDKSYILNLITLTATRNPKLRENMRDGRVQSARILMDLIMRSPEAYAAEVRRAKEAGFIEAGLNVSYEKARRFLDEGNFKIEIPNMELSKSELNNFDKILDLIAKRKWTLIRSEPDKTGFITSDHPFGILWTDPAMNAGNHPIGLGHINTVLFFPLSNELAMIGQSTGLDDQVCDIDERKVAITNGVLSHFAQKQIYARDINFKIAHEVDDKIMTGAEMVAALIDTRDY